MGTLEMKHARRGCDPENRSTDQLNTSIEDLAQGAMSSGSPNASRASAYKRTNACSIRTANSARAARLSGSITGAIASPQMTHNRPRSHGSHGPGWFSLSVPRIMHGTTGRPDRAARRQTPRLIRPPRSTESRPLLISPSTKSPTFSPAPSRASAVRTVLTGTPCRFTGNVPTSRSKLDNQRRRKNSIRAIHCTRSGRIAPRQNGSRWLTWLHAKR